MTKKQEDIIKSVKNSMIKANRKLYSSNSGTEQEQIEQYQLLIRDEDFIIDMDNRELADTIVYKAYGLSFKKGVEFVRKALLIDPENVDALNFLASSEPNSEKALELFQKALEYGKQQLGEKMFIEEVGSFWGLWETRPYMEALLGKARCLNLLGNKEESISTYEEMLRLNPNDNQGIRHLLATIYMETKNLEKYSILQKSFKDDYSATWLFSYALYLFTMNSKIADAELLNAHNQNKYVIDLMSGKKKMPSKIPYYMHHGERDEAIYCVHTTFENWKNTPGAIQWLIEFKQK